MLFVPHKFFEQGFLKAIYYFSLVGQRTESTSKTSSKANTKNKLHFPISRLGLIGHSKNLTCKWSCFMCNFPSSSGNVKQIQIDRKIVHCHCNSI